MNLVISKCVTAVKVSNFTCHYLGNRSTLDTGVLGYIGIVQHKEHPPEVWSVPPVTPCITQIHFVLKGYTSGWPTTIFIWKHQAANYVVCNMLTACYPRIANTSKLISVDARRLGIVTPKIEIIFHVGGFTTSLSIHVKLTVISL